MSVFDAVESSNLASNHKSALRKAFDRIRGYGPDRAKRHVVEAAHTLRASAESLAAGAAFGAVHAQYGLDIKGKVPADLVAGVVGAGAAVLFANEVDGISHELRNVSASGFTVFGMRKAYAFIAARQVAKGQSPVGTFTSGGGSAPGLPAAPPAAPGTPAAAPAAVHGDPIVDAARYL
jgi:hypothetical protein